MVVGEPSGLHNLELHNIPVMTSPTLNRGRYSGVMVKCCAIRSVVWYDGGANSQQSWDKGEERTLDIDVVFSRVKPASWPPLHAARPGENRTLCGIDISMNWDSDNDCTAQNVECKRCEAVLSANAE